MDANICIAFPAAYRRLAGMTSGNTGSPEPCLYLFTDQYPYGKNETFLETEIRYLAEAFREVRIIPRRGEPGGTLRKLPAGVVLRPALFRHPGRGHALLQGLKGSAPWRPFLRELRAKQICRYPKRGVKGLEAWCVVRRMLTHPDYPFGPVKGARAVLYFYWGVGCSWALPFLPAGSDAVVRYHGHDLYEERREYRGYMPFRAEQLQASRLAVCISEHGLGYLRRHHADLSFASRLHRLGVEDRGLAPWWPARTFRIATCSRLVALKRLDLLMAALAQLDFPVCWTHIGSGPVERGLKKRAAELPANISIQWLGQLPNEAVRRHYLEHPQDWFVNVSASEGSPVTVMEALNAGIPVLATDVGGTGELFTAQAGRLLPAELNPHALARALRAAHAEPEPRARRAAARRCWAERSDAARNYPMWLKTLQETVRPYVHSAAATRLRGAPKKLETRDGVWRQVETIGNGSAQEGA